MGVPLSGAIDQQAFTVGNLLVGNDLGAASIEITLGGFEAEFLGEVHFAVTGSDQAPRVNGEPIASWTYHVAGKGDILSLGYARSGLRSYLVLSGGVDVPVVMGSRSTYLRAGFGGYEGRALKKGDIVRLGDPTGKPFCGFPSGLIPAYSDEPTLRVILGPQDDYVTARGMETFLSGRYEVSSRGDRMGISLSGPVIEFSRGADIISDGTCPGAVQVHGDRQPTILGADCQTVGGYVKIATVISADLPLVAQLPPGSRTRFKEIDLLGAREIYMKNQFKLRSLYERHGNTRSAER
jgi:biotin-dependent carboxylase-like uncharacterized protein